MKYKNIKHEQSSVSFQVDKKIAPLIQYILDNYGFVIPIASCQGGDQKLDIEKSYIMFLVRDMTEFNNMCIFLGITEVEYIVPINVFACTPSYIIRFSNLDSILHKIKHL